MKYLKSSVVVLALYFSASHLGANEHILDILALGKSFFTKPWVLAPSSTTARDGLGPLFNANSCLSCHPKNGKGTLSSVVAKLNVPNQLYGSQISTKGTKNTPREAVLKVTQIPYKKPNIALSGLNYGKLSSNLSTYIAPSLYGIGLLEQIPEAEIIKNAKNNGGKIAYLDANKKHIGRFAYKAIHPLVVNQVADALNNDMGLTSSIHPNDNCAKLQYLCQKEASKDQDVSDKILYAISDYVKSIKVIQNSKQNKLFNSTGCASCHRPKYQVQNQNIYPYTDLLLHDMGELLADGRSIGAANGKEFRTTALWGMAQNIKNLGSDMNYLHDGRAKNITQAVFFHEGDAEFSKRRFFSLTGGKQQEIIDFVEGL